MKNINQGYMVVDDFLDESLANQLRDFFNVETEWNEINQKRESHYSHVFYSGNKAHPESGEAYSANFWRSNSLESNHYLKNIYNNNIIKKLTEMTNYEFVSSDVRCYKLMPGDYYRSHCDDYAGDIGLILYLNQNWKYDWGGLLNISDGMEIKSIMPVFNRAVIIWHEIFRLHHCVSLVAHYALEPRYTITSFNKILKPI